jgi:hypothetical protein
VEAPRAQSLKKDEKPEFCATLPRPTGRAPPSMSEDSKSISGAMAGRVLGEEPGREQVEEGEVMRAAMGTRVRTGPGSQRRASFGAEIERSGTTRKVHSSLQATTFIFKICFTSSRSEYGTRFYLLFDSVPTRFCLGTWQTVLSSPLLVTWKINPLGPRLDALSEIVVIRVLNQVAHVYRFTCK